MHRTIKTIRRFLITLTISATICAQATEFVRSKSPYRLPPDETLEDLFLVQAPAITLDGLATDDVFLLALPAEASASGMSNDNLSLNGTFSNDVWALGVNVRVTGTIYDHARIAALRLLDFNGVVQNGLLALGETVRIGPKARIGRQAFVIGGEVILEGVVQGPANIRARRVTVAGTVEGNADIQADEVILMSGARIEGDLSYTMARELVPPPDAHIAGTLHRRTIPPAPPSPRIDWGMPTQSFLLAGALATGMLLFWLFPTFASDSVRAVRLGPWRAAFVGFVAFCLIPLSSVLLFVTLVGIPLGLVGLLLFGLLMYFGRILTAVVVGVVILRTGSPAQPSRFFAALTVGLLCLFLLVNLPSPFGIISWFAITWIGMGGILLAALDRRFSGVINPVHVMSSPPPLPPEGRPAV